MTDTTRGVPSHRQRAEAQGRPANANRAGADGAPGGSGHGWRAYLRALGPGVVTGASDDDPSGIATYSRAGAQFGLGLLWASLVTLPLMAAVQEICDRTALATGRSLGELAVERFQRRARIVLAVLLAALIAANMLNISADLIAVGEGMRLLHAGPPWVWALGSGMAVAGLVSRGSFHLIAKVFKVSCLALLAYFVVLTVVNVPWAKVGTHVLVPHVTWSRDYLSLLVAVLGTTISPYLFFWQSAHRVEELRGEPEGGPYPVELDDRPPGAQVEKERTSRADVFTGMTLSNLVMLAIIVATSVTLNHHGQRDITSAAQASQALRPIAGKLSAALFALGFIGSGMLAVPVLAGSGASGMAGLLGKRWGFSRSIGQAPVFYGLVAVGTLGGTVLTLAGVNPMKLLVLVALINGIAAAPFLVAVMLISGNRQIMGEHVNHGLARGPGWLTVTLMAVALIAAVATT